MIVIFGLDLDLKDLSNDERDMSRRYQTYVGSFQKKRKTKITKQNKKQNSSEYIPKKQHNNSNWYYLSVT